MENWKDVLGYEGLYRVSDTGEVYSLIRNKQLAKVKIGHKPNNLYYAVNLYKDKAMKQRAVHRLVMEVFKENPENLPIINHKDEDTFNNDVSNLEWCTPQYNQEYSLSKKDYEFVDPEGNRSIIRNVRKFCRENKLNHAHMYQVHKGTLKSYKGWTKYD